MTPQEIFDTVWHAMKAQNRRSYSKKGGCMYRGPFGAKCAAGHLIPDEDYSKSMEGTLFGASHSALGEGIALHWPEHLLEHRRLIEGLQDCHDRASVGNFWSEFSSRAERIAQDYNLTIPENTQ